MRSPCCLYVNPPLINFRMHELVFMKLGMHIVAPEPSSTAQSLPSVCVSVSLSPIVARQRLSKKVSVATNTYAIV
jgi:hypothetical protein